MPDASAMLSLHRTPPPNTTKGFGGWSRKYRDGAEEKNYQPGARYIASTDGFVSAISGGDDAATEIKIQTGDNSEDLLTLARATGAYGGAVLPVQKGDIWRVVATGGKCLVAWMQVNF